MRIAFSFGFMAALVMGQPGWRPLLDGQSLAGWKETPFRDPGKVRVEQGTVFLDPGKPLTGITYTRELPKTNYELRFEAVRLRGNDFFATVTFPVGDSFCTWVAGGWGGDIVGLSSIDGWTANENETRSYFEFENGRWYRFRLRVESERIQAWIDDQRVVDAAIAGREIGLRRGEIELSAPLGFASYATAGAVRRIELRTLP
jgi:hypothetical protein